MASARIIGISTPPVVSRAALIAHIDRSPVATALEQQLGVVEAAE